MSQGSKGVFGLVEQVADAGQSLTFVTRLVAAVEGVDLRVGSISGLLYIDCESVRAFVRFAREEHSQFPALSRTLSTAGTTAEVRVDGRTVALIGAGVDPGLLASRVGYGRTRLSPRGLLAVLLSTPGRWRKRGRFDQVSARAAPRNWTVRERVGRWGQRQRGRAGRARRRARRGVQKLRRWVSHRDPRG